MQRLEINVLPTSLSVIQALGDVDSFIIGEQDFALRLPVYFTREEMIEAIHLIKAQNQQVFIAVNKLIHEDELQKVESYLKEMSQYPVDGFVFGDLSVYQMAKRLGVTSKLVYNPETYVTNYKTVRFFGQKDIKRVAIAKEITLEDIKIIGNESNVEVEVLGHGATNMFHSKRDLVTSYFNFIKYDDAPKHHNQPLYLIEEKRQEEQYPMIEDQNGTHIFSSYDLCTINYLDEIIQSNVTSIRIDGLFKNDQVLKEIVFIYKEAIDDFYQDKDLYRSKQEDYLQRLNMIEGIRQFNSGFLFKKTVYKGD